MADSICEAEYIAASDIAKEAVWLRKFIIELGVASSLDGPILLYCDSTGAIAQVKEPKAHQRTKHILHHFHLVWKIVDRGDVDLQNIDGKENLVDPFTKALTIKEFDNHKSKMGIRYVPSGFKTSKSCWEMCPKKPNVKLLTVEQPSIVIDLLINKIYLASSS